MPLRMTTPRLLVLHAFLHDPGRERYGLDLALEAGLEPGTIYPILVAFENAGWLRSREEDVDPHREGRPRFEECRNHNRNKCLPQPTAARAPPVASSDPTA